LILVGSDDLECPLTRVSKSRYTSRMSHRWCGT